MVVGGAGLATVAGLTLAVTLGAQWLLSGAQQPVSNERGERAAAPPATVPMLTAEEAHALLIFPEEVQTPPQRGVNNGLMSTLAGVAGMDSSAALIGSEATLAAQTNPISPLPAAAIDLQLHGSLDSLPIDRDARRGEARSLPLAEETGSTAATNKEPPFDTAGEEVQVRPGDSLARIMARAGYGARLVHEIVEAGEETHYLSTMHPGETLTLYRDSAGELTGIRYAIDGQRELRIVRDGEETTARIAARPAERQRFFVEETIEGSLYRSANRAGLGNRLTMRLANLLSEEIDLGRTLRSGDRIAVVYDRLVSPEGKTLDTILQAVRYEGQLANLEAIRYESDDGLVGYFDLDGNNVRRKLERYPVEFSRVSSHFDLNRRHPILGVRRPHLGVDLAAPAGSPVRAAGDGRVIERTRNGGYGRVITIDHGSGYRTRYAHLNGYASGLREGDRVKRGQLIGYVGASGTATGPHLHYEVIVNGQHRDPLKVNLPRGESLPQRHRADFLDHARPIAQALRGLDGGEDEIRVAAFD
ncbi:hypothetical protein CKO15_12210 [Halorhodospira abdelmalekii]|nr:hypothetical protein [Halorhodospira abdelmalekii]